MERALLEGSEHPEAGETEKVIQNNSVQSKVAKMKDVSLSDYITEDLSNCCGLSCTSRPKGTNVNLEFVQWGESLPCRSMVWKLIFRIRAG